MYITTDLFGGTPLHNRCDTTTSTYWATMTDAPHTACLGKRRRTDDEDAPGSYASRPSNRQYKQTDSHSSCSRQQRVSPSRRTHDSSPNESNRGLPYAVCSTPSMYSASERRPVKQMKRYSPKATLVKSTSHLMDIEPDLPQSLSKPEAHPQLVTDLRPCHACKSAPKRRRDLENYLDCRRCVGRTCYICARQCFGGCGKAVCKKCIVEVGEEGDPWCLDCYARNINS
jgi:hypothetical protein